MSTQAQQEYRNLGPCEVIKPGDEFKCGSGAWAPVYSSAGHTPAFMRQEYRRPIKPEPVTNHRHCHQCQGRLGLGYHTDSDGHEFCGDRCVESFRKIAHFEGEVDRMKASLVECERLRQEAVKSEAVFLKMAHQWQCAAMERQAKVEELTGNGFKLCSVAGNSILDTQRIEAENAKLLALIKACACHFEELNSVSWSVGSDFNERSYRTIADEVLKVALVEPEDLK